jgi:hypothetical protein
MIETPAIGMGVVLYDFQAPDQTARAVIVEVMHPDIYKSSPGVSVDFLDHPGGRSNLNGTTSFRRFYPWGRLFELSIDPAGPYAVPRFIKCSNPHCCYNSGHKGTTLPHCPNCHSPLKD